MTVNGLRELEDGWDSYGGKAPTASAIDAAEQLLASMVVVPLNDGGAQVESSAAGLDVEIEFAADGTLNGVFVSRVKP